MFAKYINKFIFWQIPPQGCVCYSCWVAARRNVQRAQIIDEVRENAVSAHRHLIVSCALCGMSLLLVREEDE